MDMDKDKAEKFGKWLTRKFLDLQSQSGRMWTISEFAKYLGCPQQSVSRWMASIAGCLEGKQSRLTLDS